MNANGPLGSVSLANGTEPFNGDLLGAILSGGAVSP